MAEDRVRLFGIRHHGPGSAFALERALDELDPAMVLIEGPPETEPLLPFVASPAMRPPVALLIHSKEDPTIASFYPFAEFSPEWRAIGWALARGRIVRLIDLPAAHRLAERLEEAKRQGEKEDSENKEDSADQENLDGGEEISAELSPPSAPAPDRQTRLDPLTSLAAVAGYQDAESWWNALVEQQPNPTAVFPAIEEAMTTVRAAFPNDPDPVEALWEARREAHMRLAIRDAVKETSGSIAVVVGAWHVPALRSEQTTASDRATLRGIPKIPVVSTWVPWTDARLAAASGYQAGIISPGWYRHLAAEMRRPRSGPYLDQAGHGARWQARVAGLLRNEGLAASPATVIEATRLGIALAALRGHPLPGLTEMRDSALATLCGGEELPLRLIDARLIIGTEVGEVDPEVPQMPLQADLTRWQKKLRLEPTALDQEISLDLRTETGLAKSSLLRRLQLIRVPWGALLDAGRSRGTFRERWTISWDPEYSVRLAEALRWGSTIEQAAGGAVIEAARDATAVGRVASLLGDALLADLGPVAETVMGKLQALAAQSGEVMGLMGAVPPLADTLRYGTARRLPEQALTRLIETLLIEISVGLPNASRGIDDDQAEAMATRVGEVDHAVSLLERDDLTGEWTGALGKVAADDRSAPTVRGAALRRRYDRGLVDPDQLGRAISRGLSPAVAPGAAGAWISGFLAGSGQLLLHDDVLFGGLDAWLADLEEEPFTTVLPLIRRGFGTLDLSERRRLLELVRRGRRAGPSRTSADGASGRSTAFEASLPLLKQILGLS